MTSNPCTDELTDSEYLHHMIPHHVVAINMSELLMKESNNPYMLNVCRDIIRKQRYEIWEMEIVNNSLGHPSRYPLFTSDKSVIDKNVTTMSYYSNSPQSTYAKCDPLYFKPNEHREHMLHTQITNRSYLEHMIPHHQIAIDMSIRLLLHTSNSYLLDFCRKLIIEQQGEIMYMRNLLDSTLNFESDLLT